mmetsp:Transcript_27134/g.57942  ORF Transcript_27134/g.57942 Transcript_27134/m.57942 type:complete len:330 (+) Transcript_27134:227-1216(+)
MNVDHPSRRPKSDILSLIALHKKEASLASLIAFVLLVACINSYLTNPEESKIVSSTRLASLEESTGGNTLSEITLGEVTYSGSKTMPYYHCGPLPLPLPGSPDNEHMTELVLLHGAAFTKEDWRDSGILQSLCDVNDGSTGAEDQSIRKLSDSRYYYPRPLSVTALDLPVPGEGDIFYDAIQSLASQHVLSGNPVVIVSPSAGGRAIVSLGEMAVAASSSSEEEEDEEEQRDQRQTPPLLEKTIKAWIPVASGAVLRTTDEVLELFPKVGVEILSINGNLDYAGRRSTERLVDVCGAKGVELKGTHPVYLDSPEEFVDEVLKFMIEKEL